PHRELRTLDARSGDDADRMGMRVDELLHQPDALTQLRSVYRPVPERRKLVFALEVDPAHVFDRGEIVELVLPVSGRARQCTHTGTSRWVFSPDFARFSSSSALPQSIILAR